MRILDAHYATLDPLNSVALVAKLEDIAGQAFNGEILVDCPDKMVFRLDQYPVVGVIGNGAAGSERRQPCTTSPTQHPLTRSWWISAPRRPRRVLKPFDSISTTASKSCRGRSR